MHEPIERSLPAHVFFRTAPPGAVLDRLSWYLAEPDTDAPGVLIVRCGEYATARSTCDVDRTLNLANSYAPRPWERLMFVTDPQREELRLWLWALWADHRAPGTQARWFDAAPVTAFCEAVYAHPRPDQAPGVPDLPMREILGDESPSSKYTRRMARAKALAWARGYA